MFAQTYYHCFLKNNFLVWWNKNGLKRNSKNLFPQQISQEDIMNYCYLKVLWSCCIWKLAVDRKIDIRGVIRVFRISSWKEGKVTLKFTKYMNVKCHYKTIQRGVYLNWVFILRKFHSANFLWRSKCKTSVFSRESDSRIANVC